MKVVILCGGRGTRIRDVSEVLPKPMVPIGGMPILWHIMKMYAHFGMTEFVLCLGYKGWQIKDFFLNYQAICHDFTLQLGAKPSLELHENVEEEGWKITFAETGEESMTGTRLWRVRKYLEGEKHFCLTYADGLADVNINALVEHHLKNQAVGTITAVRPSSRFGEVLMKDSRVTSFNEKPNVAEGWINGGFMVFDNSKIWDYLWDDEKLLLEQVSLPAMVKDGQLVGFAHQGFWLGMDTPREYDILNTMWASGKAPWKNWK
jgi:glucose-1-phosphate cytidylyltransferase